MRNGEESGMVDRIDGPDDNTMIAKADYKIGVVSGEKFWWSAWDPSDYPEGDFAGGGTDSLEEGQ